MKNRFVLVPLCVSFCFLFLSGCASVIEGKSQDIAITTTPDGASCAFTRKDVSLGAIPATPGMLHVTKTKDDISIKCHKAGYATATYLNSSEYPEYNWAYILVGGPVGWGIDSATGADNAYTSPVDIHLLQQ